MKKCRVLLGAVLMLLIFAVSCGAKTPAIDAPTPELTAELPPTPDELVGNPTQELQDADEPTEPMKPTARPQQPDPIVIPFEEGQNTETEYTVSQYHPIICDSIIIGGFRNGLWLTAEEVTPHIDGTELYRYYDGLKYIGDGFGGTVYTIDGMDFVSSGTPPYKSIEDVPTMAIQICADWDITPQTVAEQSLNNDTYKQVVKDVLARYGLETDDIVLKQHFRIDFEGDGVDEVVLYAESPMDGWIHTAYEGAYSVLIVRKIVDGKVEDFVLHIDITMDYEQAVTNSEYGYEPLRYFEQVVGFYDLNGDGTSEILTYMQYSGGGQYYIYEIEADGPSYIMGNGWSITA